jgi:transposase
MPKPCSSDLCQRAIALVEAGQTRRAAARLLNIGKATVILWVRDYRATGKQCAEPMGGAASRFSLSVTGCWRGLRRLRT